MWDDLLKAMALVLVFEGMMPFLNPARWRSLMKAVSAQNDKALRIFGLGSMCVGLLLLSCVG